MNARTHRIVVPFGLAVACAVALAGGAQASHPTGRPGRPDRGRRNASRRRHARRVRTGGPARESRPRAPQRQGRHAWPRQHRGLHSHARRVRTGGPARESRPRAPRRPSRHAWSRQRSVLVDDRHVRRRLPWLGRCALRRGRRAWHRPAWRRGRDHAVPTAPSDPPLIRIQSEYANYREINRPKICSYALA